MKSLIKYQFVLLVTLVVGYSQLFAPVSRINTIGLTPTSEELKSQVNALYCGELIYFEEDRDGEDERLARKQFELADYFLFFNGADWQFSHGRTTASISGSIFTHPSPGHIAYFALRL